MARLGSAPGSSHSGAQAHTVSHGAPSFTPSGFHGTTGAAVQPSPPEVPLQWGSEAAAQRQAIWTANVVPSRIHPPKGTSTMAMAVGKTDSDPQTQRLPEVSARSFRLFISSDCCRDLEQSRGLCSHFRQGKIRVCPTKGSGPGRAASLPQTLPLGFHSHTFKSQTNQ